MSLTLIVPDPSSAKPHCNPWRKTVVRFKACLALSGTSATTGRKPTIFNQCCVMCGTRMHLQFVPQKEGCSNTDQIRRFWKT